MYKCPDTPLPICSGLSWRHTPSSLSSTGAFSMGLAQKASTGRYQETSNTNIQATFSVSPKSCNKLVLEPKLSLPTLCTSSGTFPVRRVTFPTAKAYVTRDQAAMVSTYGSWPGHAASYFAPYMDGKPIRSETHVSSSGCVWLGPKCSTRSG